MRHDDGGGDSIQRLTSIHVHARGATLIAYALLVTGAITSIHAHAQDATICPLDPLCLFDTSIHAHAYEIQL